MPMTRYYYTATVRERLHVAPCFANELLREGAELLLAGDVDCICPRGAPAKGDSPGQGGAGNLAGGGHSGRKPLTDPVYRSAVFRQTEALRLFCRA